MNISFVDAMSLRDGGTTYVSLRKEDEVEITYSFDYSLPCNDRPRTIAKVQTNKPTVKFQVGSQQEREVCECVKAILVRQFGQAVVETFEYDSTKNPGEASGSMRSTFLGLLSRIGSLNRILLSKAPIKRYLGVASAAPLK